MNPIIYILIGFVIGAVTTWMLRDFLTKIKNNGNTRNNDPIDLDSLLGSRQAFGQKKQQPRDWGKVCERWIQKEKEGVV